MRKTAAGVLGLLCATITGCATVSVYETASIADVELSAPRSELHEASKAYCELSRDNGWAEGESSWSKLTRMLGGDTDDGGAYWRRIGADELSPASVMARVSADAKAATDGLLSVNGFAEALIKDGDETLKKSDIVEFERALIHATQARESFSMALSKAKARADENVSVDVVLADFDIALADAKLLADELAAARMSGAVAGLSNAVS